jgi:hypothetical protein
MGKLTKEQAEAQDRLLEELYGSNICIPFLGEGFSPNERNELARTLVEDGYAEILIHREGGTVYLITTKGRQFCRAGGYMQPFKDAKRTAKQRWIDRICGFLSGAVFAWALNHFYRHFCL